jgi:uncharacterized coiled-coil protein SlyX
MTTDKLALDDGLDDLLKTLHNMHAVDDIDTRDRLDKSFEVLYNQSKDIDIQIYAIYKAIEDKRESFTQSPTLTTDLNTSISNIKKKITSLRTSKNNILTLVDTNNKTLNSLKQQLVDETATLAAKTAMMNGLLLNKKELESSTADQINDITALNSQITALNTSVSEFESHSLIKRIIDSGITGDYVSLSPADRIKKIDQVLNTDGLIAKWYIQANLWNLVAVSFRNDETPGKLTKINTEMSSINAILNSPDAVYLNLPSYADTAYKLEFLKRHIDLILWGQQGWDAELAKLNTQVSGVLTTIGGYTPSQTITQFGSNLTPEQMKTLNNINDGLQFLTNKVVELNNRYKTLKAEYASILSLEQNTQVSLQNTINGNKQCSDYLNNTVIPTLNSIRSLTCPTGYTNLNGVCADTRELCPVGSCRRTTLSDGQSVCVFLANYVTCDLPDPSKYDDVEYIDSVTGTTKSLRQYLIDVAKRRGQFSDNPNWQAPLVTDVRTNSSVYLIPRFEYDGKIINKTSGRVFDFNDINLGPGTKILGDTKTTDPTANFNIFNVPPPPSGGGGGCSIM